MSEPERPQAQRTLRRQPPPPGIYASKYDPELAGAICRRLAAGESLASICRADPSMPTEKTVWNWTRSHPDFAAMKQQAQDTARARALAERDREAAARRVVPAGVRRRRPWNRGLDGYACAPEVAEAVLTQVAMGRSLADVCREPWAPCVGTVFNWLKRYPELLAEYRRARRLARWVFCDRAMDLAPLARKGSLRRARRALKAITLQEARQELKRYAEPGGG